MTPAERRIERLAAAHGARVLAYLGRRTTPHEDAADLYQHVLTTTWRKIHTVPDGDEEALCWMLAVARRELANHRRGATRRLAATDRLRDAIADRAAEPRAPDDRVHAALDNLSAHDRELITLTYWDELTAEQVGRVLGLSATATRKRLQRARARLADRLTDRDHETRDEQLASAP